jgi:hypothetical protein
MLWVIEVTVLVGLVAGGFVGLEILLRLRDVREGLEEEREKREKAAVLEAVKVMEARKETPRPRAEKSRTTFDVDRERMDETRRETEKNS